MPIDRRPLAVFVMGPTASGKTALACALADQFRLGLVSVDSALVYRGFDIGAAKPDAATRARYPHRLIDIRDAAQPYSAADFRVDALGEMRAISASGATPLLVGGTGLYFRALQYGLSDLPAADDAVRARIASDAARVGWSALHGRLSELDADAARRIRPGDAQRIQRALEVIELTGRPLSQQQGGPRNRFAYRVLKLVLMPADRAVLHCRIAERIDAMLAAGFLDEVRALRAQAGFARDLPAWRAVGYRQACEFLDGGRDVARFRERAIFATRQLAKRQITWLRSEFDALALDPFRTDPGAPARLALEMFLAATPAESAMAAQM